MNHNASFYLTSKRELRAVSKARLSWSRISSSQYNNISLIILTLFEREYIAKSLIPYIHLRYSISEYPQTEEQNITQRPSAKVHIG
jgi:hypothetical protein